MQRRALLRTAAGAGLAALTASPAATETNPFGLRELMRFRRLVDVEPCVAADVGSGSPELRDGVPYGNAPPGTVSITRGTSPSPSRRRRGEAMPRTRTFSKPLFGLAGLLLLHAAVAARAQEAKRATVTIRAGEPGPRISRHLYGHFAEHLGRCIYDGLWVGQGSKIPNTRGIRNDVVQALRRIRIPNLRWPGGCFADQYHWEDGAPGKRPRRVNIHWGGVVEDNSFGTHEFLDLCEQVGAVPPRSVVVLTLAVASS